MTAPKILDARGADVRQHWEDLGTRFRAILPKRGGHYTVPATSSLGLTAVLRCTSFANEIAERELGGPIPVVPLLEVGIASGTSVARWWLSWCEQWTIGKGGKLAFSASNLAIFWDDPSGDRVQMFRAEWAGAKQKSATVELDGGQAGHPHWQIDALRIHCQRLTDRLQSWHAQKALATIEQQIPQPDIIQDFAPLPETKLASPNLGIWAAKDLDWCGIHLPVNASWAKQPWSGGVAAETHARAPEDAAEVRNWVTSTIQYVAYEISKFV